MSAHSFPRIEARTIDERFTDKIVRSPSNVDSTWILPGPNDPSVPYLPLYHDEFGCHACPFVCRTKESIKGHYSKSHRSQFQSIKILWRKGIHIQSFAKGVKNQCFEINKDHVSVGIKTSIEADDVQSLVRRRLHSQIRLQIDTATESMMTIEKSSISTEVSPWLERTRWIDHLQGYDLRRMAKSTDLPTKRENILETICQGIQRSIIQMKQMVLDQKIGHFDLKQINSFDRYKSFSKPLNVQIQDSTFNFYISVWQRLVC